MSISSGGTANNTRVNSDGTMYIYSGGTAHNTILNKGGEMYIGAGGIATNLVAHAGALLSLTVAPDTYIQGNYAGAAFETKNGYISDVSVQSGCTITVYRGGIAENMTLGGWMHINGQANNVTVNKGGGLSIDEGGEAINIKENGGYVGTYGGKVTFVPNTIHNLVLEGNATSAAMATIHAETTAVSVTVSDCAFLYVYGGTATAIKENGGYVYFDENADVTFIPNTIRGKTVEPFGQTTLHSGTSAENITIGHNAHVFIYSSGTASNVTLNDEGAFLHIYNGGTAEDIKMATSCHTELDVYAGGIANNIQGGAIINVEAGGTATNIDYIPGLTDLYIEDGAYVTFVSQYQGCYLCSDSKLISRSQDMVGMNLSSDHIMTVMSGGTANYTTLADDADVKVSSGGTASNTTLDGEYATLRVFKGGTASKTTVNDGVFFVSSGGIALKNTINKDGQLTIAAGAIATSNTVNGGRLLVY